MKIVGLDLGTVTLGISISDPTNTIACSSENFRFEHEDFETALEKVKTVLESINNNKVVLGFPKNMNNTIGPSAERSLKFKEMLENENIEVILFDERLSTKLAENVLISANLKRKSRKKQVDKLAATIILQGYLDQTRR